MSWEPEWYTISLLTRPLIVGIFAAAIFAVIFSTTNPDIAYRDKLKANIVPALAYSVPVAFIAYLAGHLTGSSRSPAVGTVVPATLTLIGGLNIYLFGVQVQNRLVVGYSVLLFSVVMFYGVQVGTSQREYGRVERLIFLSEQEKQIRNYRENRGLNHDIPSWVTTGEPK